MRGCCKKMGANNKKLSIDEVKSKLSEIDKDIIVLDDDYLGNKHKLKCECLICGNKFSKSWNLLSKGQGCPACGKNGVKITKQEIKNHIEYHNYSVIRFTKDDSNKGTMFIVRCHEGHEYETSYREFNREENKRNGSCKECNQIRIGSTRRKDISVVMKNISEWGYTVDENFQYKNSLEIYKFTCMNGHERKISYHSLERTPICPECVGSPLRHTEDNLREILRDLGLRYIDGYKGSNEKFSFECECGEIAENTLKAIRKGIRCRKCNEHKRYTIDDVKEIFKDEGYILLENEYSDSKTLMKFICNHGHNNTISLNSFLKGTRCRDCHFENIRGENSPHWNHNLTDDERVKNRKYPEYDEWRLSVYKRDNYTCQCCGDNTGGNLVAHHLDSHDWAKELRTDVNNGITLCKICHIDFHKLYGYGDNTKEQFEEYMQELLDSAI